MKLNSTQIYTKQIVGNSSITNLFYHNIDINGHTALRSQQN